jgi:hypothetical protein
MYSEKFTQKHCEAVEAKLGIELHRYTPEESRNLSTYLAGLRRDGKLFDGNGNFLRKEHASFVRNERILFQQDFHYAVRYMYIIKDGVEGGGIGVFRPWESQKILLDLIARLEEKNIDYYERGYPCDGILICDNKGGRQLGHTAVARAISIHRMIGCSSSTTFRSTFSLKVGALPAAVMTRRASIYCLKPLVRRFFTSNPSSSPGWELGVSLI